MDSEFEDAESPKPARSVDPRVTWWVAAAALVLALSAAAAAAVAILNTHQDGSMTSRMGGMGMGGADASHMAPIPSSGVPDAAATVGATPLPHTVVGDTWVFQLVATPVRWEIAPGVKITAWSYNGIVPGPTIRVPDGQKMRVEFRNDLPEPTTVHWHGIDVPNSMDGVADLTQPAVPPGATFSYAFTARPAGRDTGSGFGIRRTYTERRSHPGGQFHIYVGKVVDHTLTNFRHLNLGKLKPEGCDDMVFFNRTLTVPKQCSLGKMVVKRHIASADFRGLQLLRK